MIYSEKNFDAEEIENSTCIDVEVKQINKKVLLIKTKEL